MANIVWTDTFVSDYMMSRYYRRSGAEEFTPDFHEDTQIAGEYVFAPHLTPADGSARGVGVQWTDKTRGPLPINAIGYEAIIEAVYQPVQLPDQGIGIGCGLANAAAAAVNPTESPNSVGSRVSTDLAAEESYNLTTYAEYADGSGQHTASGAGFPFNPAAGTIRVKCTVNPPGTGLATALYLDGVEIETQAASINSPFNLLSSGLFYPSGVLDIAPGAHMTLWQYTIFMPVPPPSIKSTIKTSPPSFGVRMVPRRG